ncbi:MAG: LysM peptidoglycan-binding domain-containing protein [Planctomycetota bacterium]
MVAEVGSESGGARPSTGPGVVMQSGWDLNTLAGLEATIDPEVFTALVRDGDTWASIAKRYYGDEGRARLLRRSNEGTVLAAGKVVLVPAVDRLPNTPEVREVEVREGEGLWHVAKRALGDGNRWRELHEANRDRISNPDFVKPGTLLRLP